MSINLPPTRSSNFNKSTRRLLAIDLGSQACAWAPGGGTDRVVTERVVAAPNSQVWTVSGAMQAGGRGWATGFELPRAALFVTTGPSARSSVSNGRSMMIGAAN